MKKFVLFLAILSLISCKQEVQDEGKKKTDPTKIDPAPQAGNLEVKSWTNEGAKAKGANPIYLRLNNNSGEEIIVTDVKFKNPNTVFTVKDDLSAYKIAAGKGPFDLTLVINTADVTGPVTLDEPFTVTYKEGGKDRITSGEYKGTFDWVSDADVNKELKVAVTLNPKPLGPKDVAHFTIENKSKYPANFTREYLKTKKDDDKIKFKIAPGTTCGPKNSWENEGVLAPGEKCELYLESFLLKPQALDLALLFSVLGTQGSTDFQLIAK